MYSDPSGCIQQWHMPTQGSPKHHCPLGPLRPDNEQYTTIQILRYIRYTIMTKYATYTKHRIKRYSTKSLLKIETSLLIGATLRPNLHPLDTLTRTRKNRDEEKNEEGSERGGGLRNKGNKSRKRR